MAGLGRKDRFVRGDGGGGRERSNFKFAGGRSGGRFAGYFRRRWFGGRGGGRDEVSGLVLVFAEKSAMVFQAAGIGAAVVDFRGVVDAAIKLGGLAAAMGREFE